MYVYMYVCIYILGCSGVAIVSKYPFKRETFNTFNKRGDILEPDGEYVAKKGILRIQIEPLKDVQVEKAVYL